MRKLVHLLIENDPVSFYVVVEAMRADAMTRKSNWITVKAADSLFAGAKSQLCKDATVDLRKLSSINQLDIEEPTKWTKLLEILSNIKGESEGKSTLILVNKEETALLLANLCRHGSKTTLTKIATKHLLKKRKFVNTKKKGVPKYSEECAVNMPRFTKIDNCVLIEEFNAVIHFGFEGSSEFYRPSPKARMHYIIRQYTPKHIILFDPRMEDIREIENFQAELLHGDPESELLTAYVLMYAESVEEQRYLTVLRKEKEAFQSLINAKANLLLPEPSYDIPRNPYGSSTRIGGEDVVANVIVDMREFRSALPSLLHRKGFKIDPLTISVGDYILAPHICVERKSVSDFIGSLNSGRLYSQCAAMTRLYPLSVLLIEFPPPSVSNRNTFSLFIGKNTISADLTSKDILSKLALLTIHFPKLRILWSHSPYATVELFTDLKLGRPEPSVDKLPHNDPSGGSKHSEENVYNDDAVDAILRVPGVTWKNHSALVRRAGSLMGLLALSEQEIAHLIENKVLAHKIHSFLHVPVRALLHNDDGGDGSQSTHRFIKRPRFDLLNK